MSLRSDGNQTKREIGMKLSRDYNECCEQMLVNYCNALKINNRLGNRSYSLFYPLIGSKYQQNRKLMVVGRACNGWENPWTPQDTNLKEIVSNSMRGVKNDLEQCPMWWLQDQWNESNPDKKNNIHHSAFWRTVRLLLPELEECNNSNWSSFIVWSNLFKISPFNTGNPNHIEAEKQKPDCFHLFEMELAELKPKYVLMMVGWDWGREFLEQLGLKKDELPMNHLIVKKVFRYGESKIIMTVRPEKIGDEKFFAAVKEFL